VSGPLNFKLAWVFRQAGDLEDAFGEPELAALQRRRATEIGSAAVEGFWDEGRGLFADDLQHQHFSEHAQCLALLGGCVDDQRRPRVIEHLFTEPGLAQTTVYFSHYLFETCALTGRMDKLFDRLKLWFDLKGQGFKTTLESPEPSRSDCHAWGAHPMYHYYASILGIRPTSTGFATVAIRPQLGPLTWAKGTMVHPKGDIQVDVQTTAAGKIRGRVTLPRGVKGVLTANGETHPVEETATFG
jgi:alpha-L-rhamnosidase